MPTSAHSEHHVISRIGWLRAAVLGANDGLLSTASLIVGVASANPDHTQVLLAGVAGLAAGSMSMAAGEFVSVSSQSDTEEADIAREKAELRQHPQAELKELTEIYVEWGLTPDLAHQVADQLMAKDALAAHTRDELHLDDTTAARPVQAAITSAISFAAGAALPLLVAFLRPGAAHRAGGDRRIANIVGRPRRVRRICWRCEDMARYCARDVLGCAGDGDNCHDRPHFRNSRVMCDAVGKSWLSVATIN